MSKLSLCKVGLIERKEPGFPTPMFIMMAGILSCGVGGDEDQGRRMQSGKRESRGYETDFTHTIPDGTVDVLRVGHGSSGRAVTDRVA